MPQFQQQQQQKVSMSATLVLASVKFHLAPDAAHNAASRDSILSSSAPQPPRQQRVENNLITLASFLAAFSRCPAGTGGARLCQTIDGIRTLYSLAPEASSSSL